MLTLVLGPKHAHVLFPSRLIRSARVVQGQICYDIKDSNQIYELFYTRFSLHKRIYNHKTSASRLIVSYTYSLNDARVAIAKAIEYMVMDALLAADPYLKIADQVHDPKRYVYLTDDLLNRIESSTQEVGPRSLFTPDTPSLTRTHIRNWNQRERSSNASDRATSTGLSTTRSFRMQTRR